MGIFSKKSIRQTEACEVLYNLLESLDEPSPICGVSFNVILEGIFRKEIKSSNSDDSFNDQIIDYRGKLFYITRIKITNNSKDLFFPSYQADDINNIPNLIKIIGDDNCDNFYIYYDLINKDNKSYQKIPCTIKSKDKNKIKTVANFYAVVTKHHFFVEENQYLKAMLFKLLFNSKKYDNTDYNDTNKIIDKASRLLKDCFSNSKNNSLTPYQIAPNEEFIEPYLLCNAFINAYNELSNPDDKTAIIEIYDEYHPIKINM